MSRPLWLTQKQSKYRNIKIYYCPACDLGFSKKGCETHLTRRPDHKSRRIIFGSKKEFGYFRTLQLQQKAKEIHSFEIHPRLQVYYDEDESNFVAVWKKDMPKAQINAFGEKKDWELLFEYEADFLVRNFREGEIIDVKGVQTKEFKLKKKILEALGIKIILK